MRRISERGLDFIRGFESFVPYVYDDMVPAHRGRYSEWDGGPVTGTLTIGYGHTNAAKHPLKIRQGLRISETEAEEILDVDLDECEAAVTDLVKVPITQGQFDALVSFAFNCGTNNLKNIVARLNRGNAAGARAAFDYYVKSKGVVMRGLQRRRDGEQALWDADIDAPVPPPPAEPVDHPAEVDPDPAPPPATMAVSTEGNTAIAVGSAGVTTSATVLSTAVKNAAEAKAFGVWGFLIALAEQPEFWTGILAAIVLVGGPAYLWLRRRTKLVTHGV